MINELSFLYVNRAMNNCRTHHVIDVQIYKTVFEGKQTWKKEITAT